MNDAAPQPIAPVFTPRVFPERRRAYGQSARWTGVERRAAASDRRSVVLAVTCPRCGHIDHMTAATYAGWPNGIMCGLCGDPPARMVTGGSVVPD